MIAGIEHVGAQRLGHQPDDVQVAVPRRAYDRLQRVVHVHRVHARAQRVLGRGRVPGSRGARGTRTGM